MQIMGKALGIAHFFGLDRRGKPDRIRKIQPLRADDAREAKRVERRRWATLFELPEALENPAFAAHCAARTNLSPEQISDLLQDARPTTRRSRLAERMRNFAGRVLVSPSAPDAPGGDAAIAAMWNESLAGFAPVGETVKISTALAARVDSLARKNSTTRDEAAAQLIENGLAKE